MNPDYREAFAEFDFQHKDLMFDVVYIGAEKLHAKIIFKAGQKELVVRLSEEQAKRLGNLLGV